jgi:hypothetical protein
MGIEEDTAVIHLIPLGLALYVTATLKQVVKCPTLKIAQWEGVYKQRTTIGLALWRLKGMQHQLLFRYCAAYPA